VTLQRWRVFVWELERESMSTREAVQVRRTSVLARERTGRSVFMSGFARKRGSHIRGSGEHRAFGAPMNWNCTLRTLRVER
jgi:IS5 family transposase